MGRPATSDSPNAVYLRRQRAEGRTRPSHTARETYWRNIKSKYGITREEYEAILEAQGGKCAICGARPTKRRLAVDHRHDAKHGRKHGIRSLVRGLLCWLCNYYLVNRHMRSERLRRAAAYMDNPPAQKVLRAGN